MVWIREINVRGPAGPSGGIDPNDPVMVQSVQDAVDARLAAENIARAYPEDASIGYTTLPAFPMQWVYRTVRDPYSDVYRDEYSYSWQGSTRRRGDVPVLSESGMLAEAQIPATIARKSDIPDVPDVPDGASSERVIDAVRWPILAARVAKARVNGDPAAFVLAGSSTTRADPGYTEHFTSLAQDAYPEGARLPAQWSISAEWTLRTAAGLHVYNAGQGATKASNYLDDAESDRIAATNPVCILHMVGSNDYTGLGGAQTDPVVYESTLRARLAYFDSVLPLPTQHILVHAYARQDFTPPTYEHAEYLAALEAIAADRADTGAIDLSEQYRILGVPGTDLLGLISGDGSHQTSDGYRFMAVRLVSEIFT